MMALKCFSLSIVILIIFASGFIDAVPSGYTYINSTRAYYKFHTEGATWDVAVSTCQSEDARLFHPDSAEELELVWRELNVGDNGGNFFFTGLSDLDKPNEYKTADGRPMSQVYNKWEPGQPNSWGGDRRCGFLDVSTHLLFVGYCDYPIRFICKHEEEMIATDVKTVTADAVPSGYTYINSTRGAYKFHTEGAWWADAVSTCQSEGARLFHPDSAEELELVLRELAIGDSGESYLLTGFSVKDRPNEYKTVDGRPMSQVYNKWERGQPNSWGGDRRCGFLDVSTHLLFVGYCDYPRRFICKHEEEVIATDVKTVTADAVPSGYTYINSTRAYYKFHTEGATWAVAVSTCQSEDARLFHPDSAEELEQVMRELIIADFWPLFTGFSDEDKPNEYKTVDGRPISQVYNKWGPGQPNSCGGECRYGALLPSTHLLYVYYSDWPQRFICKHEEKVTATDMATVTAGLKEERTR